MFAILVVVLLLAILGTVSPEAADNFIGGFLLLVGGLPVLALLLFLFFDSASHMVVPHFVSVAFRVVVGVPVAALWVGAVVGMPCVWAVMIVRRVWRMSNQELWPPAAIAAHSDRRPP